jgi:hypothetical protein
MKEWGTLTLYHSCMYNPFFKGDVSFSFSFSFSLCFCLHTLFPLGTCTKHGKGKKICPFSFGTAHKIKQKKELYHQEDQVFEERLHQSLGPVEAWTGIFQQSQSSLFFFFAILSTSIACKQAKQVKVEATSSKGSPALQVPQALLHADLHHLGEHLLGLPAAVLPVDLRSDVADDVLQRVWLQLRPRGR